MLSEKIFFLIGFIKEPEEPRSDSLLFVAVIVFDERSVEGMLMYGKEASNRKQEIDRQHYTIPNQRPKDKHCGKI